MLFLVLTLVGYPIELDMVHDKILANRMVPTINELSSCLLSLSCLLIPGARV